MAARQSKHSKNSFNSISRRCLNGLRIAFVAWAVFCCFGFAGGRQLKFEAPCGKDMTFGEEALGPGQRVSSAIQCAAKCSNEPRCHSYTFNKYSKMCRLSSGRAKSCQKVAAEQGSRYMKAVSRTPATSKFLISSFICHV